jgi:hypothetical protein
MNSSQRRKYKRECPHAIVLTANDNERWYVYDNKVETAQKWCRKNVKGSWRTEHAYNQTKFLFSDHKTAMVFALKWV